MEGVSLWVSALRLGTLRCEGTLWKIFVDQKKVMVYDLMAPGGLKWAL